MGLDLLLLQDDKGGDLKSVIESQKRRFAPDTLVTEVLAEYKDWTKSASPSLSKASKVAEKEEG
jgi:seryl-tRNA synthetase